MDKRKLKNYAEQVKQESAGLDRRIIAKVAGVTFEGRQKVLAQIKQDTPIKLERDRRNEHDFYAVQVLAELNGEFVQAGFVPRPMSKLVSKSIDAGTPLVSSVHMVTGGMTSVHTGEDLNYGLQINIAPKR